MTHTLQLRGLTVPTMFYGTAWKEDRTLALTRLALESGFVAIDTANQRQHYFEAAVGEAVHAAIGEGRARREALFLQTKFTYLRGQDDRLPYDPRASYAEQVAQSFASSLAHFGTHYLDSLLLHGPFVQGRMSEEDAEVWAAMEALQTRREVRAIGVSNVSVDELRAFTESATIKPAFVQNRCRASNGWDRDVRAFCAANDMRYQAFSLLTANARELESPTLARIEERTGRKRAAVVFAFARALGMIPLTGTSSATHMREDLDSLDLVLEPAEVRAIETIAG